MKKQSKKSIDAKINLSDKKGIYKVAFLFTNSKEGVISRINHRQDADTALHGANFIEGADYITVIPKSIKSLFLIPRLLHYEFIITQDNVLLGYIISLCSRIFHTKTKWLYIAMNSSTLIRRHVNHPMRRFLLIKFWKSYARIICIATEQMKDFTKLGISPQRLIFIPFGIDIKFFNLKETVLEEDIIVSCGRDEGRDYQTLFKVAERTRYQFVVIASHKNIPLNTKIPKNVTVLYDKKLTEVRTLYARARIIIVVSKDIYIPDGSDCSGQTVVLEALAMGKPVIATNRPWINEYLISNKDIIVVKPNDTEALIHEIDFLWKSKETCERLKTSGYKKINLLYSTENFAIALCALMDSLI